MCGRLCRCNNCKYEWQVDRYELKSYGRWKSVPMCDILRRIFMSYEELFQKDNPVMLSGYQFIFGGIVMIILGLIMGGRINHISVSAVLMLFYLACISAVAYSLWGILLKHNPVSKVAIFGFTNPVFGVLLSAWWLGEGGKELGINALIALILVCIGILIVNVHPKENK